MRILVLSLFLWAIILVPAQAKWLTPADAATKNSYIKEISVNSNGTYEMTVEEKNTVSHRGRALAKSREILVADFA